MGGRLRRTWWRPWATWSGAWPGPGWPSRPGGYAVGQLAQAFEGAQNRPIGPSRRGSPPKRRRQRPSKRVSPPPATPRTWEIGCFAAFRSVGPSLIRLENPPEVDRTHRPRTPALSRYQPEVDPDAQKPDVGRPAKPIERNRPPPRCCGGRRPARPPRAQPAPRCCALLFGCSGPRCARR